MEIDRKELKLQARQAMSIVRPKFWVVALVYFLMTTGLSGLADILLRTADASSIYQLDMLAIFVSILLFLYTSVVGFGYTLWSLWTARRQGPGLGALVDGFSMVGRVIMLQLLILARTFLWMIPIAFFSTLLVMMLEPLLIAIPILIVPLIIVIAIVIFIIILRYALAQFLLADHPDDGPGVALRRSVEMMKNWTWELFLLDFSFIGWDVLSSLLSNVVLGVLLWQEGFFQALLAGANTPTLYNLYLSVNVSPQAMVLSSLIVLPLTLWLHPYRSVTRAGFYEARLRLQVDAAPPL